MATNHVPDHIPSMMEEQFGTIVLITDTKADQYLTKASKDSEERDSDISAKLRQ
jgi:hypothetical protein